MTAVRQRQRRLLQWVLCALLATALVPTLSRALGHWRGQVAPWAEICATSLAAAPADAAAAQADLGLPAHLLDHCPMCSLQQDTPGALPVAASPWRPAALRDGPPAAFYQVPRTPHAWSPAHARAPPALS